MINEPSIRKEYVAGFYFNRAVSSVVLIRKKRPDWQSGRLNGVGGKVECETSLEAMIREFEEETGVTQCNWTKFCTLRGGDNLGQFAVHFFHAVGDILQCRTMTDEVVQVFTVRDLPSNVLPNLHWLIPMATNHIENGITSHEVFEV